VFVVAIVTKKHFLNKCLFSCHKEKKKKYRCLAFHSLFYRGFGCDNHVTDSLILLESVREYLQPFVILALKCCRSFSYNSFFAGSFSDTTHVEVQALVRVCHPWGPVVTGRCLHFPCVHPYLSKLVDCFMKIGAVVPFLITYSSCYLRLVQKFLIGCLSFMSIRCYDCRFQFSPSHHVYLPIESVIYDWSQNSVLSDHFYRVWSKFDIQFGSFIDP
jgi:hypothetical protein